MSEQHFILIIPPEGVTATSVLLLWNKSSTNQRVVAYQIFINGEPAEKINVTDHTVTGLEPGTAYTFQITEILENGGDGATTAPVAVTTVETGHVLSIADHGAKGDAQTLNTLAIQSAIDACPPGGTVLVPSGVFRTGALFLKSCMTLHLADGAVLLGSEDAADYPVIPGHFEGRKQPMYAALINCTPLRNGYVEGAERLHDVKITGQGLIKANARPLFHQQLAQKAGVRGRNIYIANTDRVYIHGVTIRESPAWCLHLVYCNQVSINGISLHSKYDEEGHVLGIYNGDGIDPDSCMDVNIVNSLIASQDDCIAVKSGRDAEGRAAARPSERVRISNCRFRNGFGVALGSEMSGGVRDVLVQDCSFTDSFSVGSIKAPRGRGNVIENALYDNLTLVNHDPEHQDCRWFRGGINVDMFYSLDEVDHDHPLPVDEGTPVFRNITFQNISLETVGGNAIFIAGLPESPVENLTLRNVHAKGKYGMQAHNTTGLQMENVTVEILPS